MKKLIAILIGLLVGITSSFAKCSGLETQISSKDKKELEKTLFVKYGGKEQLIPYKKDFKKIKTLRELQTFLVSHINDYHFGFHWKCSECGYYHIWNIEGKLPYAKVVTDFPQIKSFDDKPLRKYIRTSNTEYYRNNDCKVDEEYLNTINLIKGDLSYIVLDFRTNKGGGNIYIFDLMDRLVTQNYKGKVVVLQDNYSFSSGEAWAVVGGRYSDYLDTLLVGQYSGGMQSYGNCEEVEFNDFWFRLPTTKMTLPKEFEGEGRGYKPHIFVNTLDELKSKLVDLGLDLEGVNIK